MAKRQKDLTEQVVFRMSPDLRSALEADAHRNGRNLAQTIRFLLERSPALAGGGQLDASAPTSV